MCQPRVPPWLHTQKRGFFEGEATGKWTKIAPKTHFPKIPGLRTPPRGGPTPRVGGSKGVGEGGGPTPQGGSDPPEGWTRPPGGPPRGTLPRVPFGTPPGPPLGPQKRGVVEFLLQKSKNSQKKVHQKACHQGPTLRLHISWFHAKKSAKHPLLGVFLPPKSEGFS